MSEKDKTRNDHVSDFVRYHGNKMTDKERNAFEKNLQKDPFANEASEGFDLIDPSIAKMDLLTMGKRLRKRSSGKQRIIWYRIAASVTVLMILSSVFLIVKRERPSTQISYSQAPPSYKETPEKPEQEKAPGKMEKKEPAAIVPNIAKEVQALTQKPESISDKKIEKRKENTLTEQQADLIVAQAVQPEKAVAAGEKTLAPQAVMIKRSSDTYSGIKGKIVSSEDNQPIQGVTISVKGTKTGTVTDSEGYFRLETEDARNRMLVAEYVGMESKEFKAEGDTSLEIKLEPSLAALSEIVVVGSGAKSKDYGREDALTDYIPPRPLNGEAEFDKYIKENIIRPDTSATGQRVVVVLSFIVGVNGKIDSIKIMRSPDKIFSDEAIRLIKEGPEWKPAEENGKVINDEVRIRIVFK